MLAAFRGNVPFRSFLFVGELLRRIPHVTLAAEDIRFIFVVISPVVCSVIRNIEFCFNKVAVTTRHRGRRCAEIQRWMKESLTFVLH